MPSEKEIDAIMPILEDCFGILGSGNVSFKESIHLTAKLVLQAAEKVRWQPIETAPKDSTDILVFVETASVPIVHIARWEVGDENFGVGWWSYTHNSVGQEMLTGFKYPTHWMPLPAA